MTATRAIDATIRMGRGAAETARMESECNIIRSQRDGGTVLGRCEALPVGGHRPPLQEDADAAARRPYHYFAAVLPPCSLIQRWTRSWRRSSGMAPPFRISSWKALISNLAPSAAFASSRNLRMVN